MTKSSDVKSNAVETFAAGRYEQQYQYQSFMPEMVNREWVLSDPQTLTLLGEANRLLGELNAFAQLVPDVDFFINMHIVKEATTSSRIEGTQTNMGEALITEKDVNPEKRDDWQEVQNYIRAINFSIKRLKDIPLCNRLLQETHRTLMQGVRGRHKHPGELRVSQNWIGVSLKHATFVPPHHDHVPGLMGDLEKFIHNEQIHVPDLVKIALIHYQFETIHPFLDGNGRLGRLLIVLYLVNFGLLGKPALYLSDFFERNKEEYYDRLAAVRSHNKLMAWISFFLLGVVETAERSIQVFKDLIALRQEIESTVLPRFHARRQDNAQTLMRYLYQQPVVSVSSVKELLEVQANTASKLINDFVERGVLRELTGQKRNRLFIFHRYVALFLDREG